MGKSVGALLLAAGFSRRFGDAKLFATLPNVKSIHTANSTRFAQSELDSSQPDQENSTVLSQTYRHLSSALTDIIIVTRPELAENVSRQAKMPLIFNGAAEGMGASLAFGISHAAELGWDACMICLADMPFIQQSTYAQLAAAADAEKILVPAYQGKSGNPVVFGSMFFPELARLTGDTGGRGVIRSHLPRVRKITVSDPAVLTDIDTPADLQKAAKFPYGTSD